MKIVNKCHHVESLPSPRFIKTHHPISMLPPDLLDKAKVDLSTNFYSCLFLSGDQTLSRVKLISGDLRGTQC